MPGPHLGGKFSVSVGTGTFRSVLLALPSWRGTSQHQSRWHKLCSSSFNTAWLQHCKKALAAIPIDTPPQRALKVAEDKSNLSPNQHFLPYQTLCVGGGQGGCQSIAVRAVRASCCFVLPIAETVCTLLVQITSTFLVPPRNHLLRS